MKEELRLDWFEATLETATQTLLLYAMLIAPNGVITQGKGRHGYKRATIFTDEDLTFTVLDIGNGGWPHIVASGHWSDTVRRMCKSLNVEGRITRVDIACDSLEGWNPAEKRVLQWADDHPKSKLIMVGDFYRQEAGRTYYVGAASSDRRIRIYEKGIQLGENPEWVRVEYQLRPKERAAKTWAYKASLEEIANSSRAFVALRAKAGFYAPPVYDRQAREPIFALARQYGNALKQEVPEAYRLIIDYLQHEWRPKDD